jgi:hypothetical protein
MQKSCFFLFLGSFLALVSCNPERKNHPAPSQTGMDEQHIFPVTSFLKAQLRSIDTLPVTPVKIVTEHGKVDSVWLVRRDIRKNAGPFLTPVIDSATMSAFFSEKSFLDQTINAFTFSYDPRGRLPDSLDLTHWDVYMNPQTTTVSRIYMVKHHTNEGISYTDQLTWVVNKWYSILTIMQKPGGKPEVSEVKMVWDFD